MLVTKAARLPHEDAVMPYNQAPKHAGKVKVIRQARGRGQRVDRVVDDLMRQAEHQVELLDKFRDKVQNPSCPGHGSLVISGLTPYGEPRCMHCGHRVSNKGLAPRQSRELPFWTWPLELLGRYQARRAHASQGTTRHL